MQKNVEQHLNQLCNLACELGASNAKVFDAKDVVVDERVRMKCQIPRCDDYGINLMCPPHLGITVSEFTRILSKYRVAMLLQVDCPIPQEMQQLIESGADLNSLYKNPAFLASNNESINRAKMKLHDLVNQVEASAFSLSFRFATGFIGGSCRLCTECVAAHNPNGPCKHPFKSRPSMEGMGIDVVQTAINAGLPFDVPPKDKTVWTGLILIE